MPPAILWKPDVSLYNKQDLSNGILAADPRSSNTNAQLFSNGNIVWTVPVSHKVRALHSDGIAAKTAETQAWDCHMIYVTQPRLPDTLKQHDCKFLLEFHDFVSTIKYTTHIEFRIIYLWSNVNTWDWVIL